MEPVDASIIEARSIYLEREPWRGLGRYIEPTGLWSLLEEFSTGLYGKISNTTVAGDPSGRSGLLNRCC